MTNAIRDNNNIPALLGVLNTNGTTLVRVQANPSTHTLIVDNASTGSDFGPTGRALRDENNVTTMCATSEIDGVTPVPIYVTSDGKLLMDSN